MSSIGFLKNKKIILALGLALLLIIGFFAFKLLSGGGEAQVQPKGGRTVEKAPSQERSQRKARAEGFVKKELQVGDTLRITKTDSTEKLPGETPLYQLLKNWRDPFGTGNQRVTELEERIKIIKKEIELLRDSLEREKLEEELAEFKKSYSPAPAYVYQPKNLAQAKSSDRIIVKAILISESKKTALLYLSNKKAWVKEGELFEGWMVSEISSNKVVLTREGRAQILGYHPVPVFEGGKNE